MFKGFRFHHIGCLVKSIDDSLLTFKFFSPDNSISNKIKIASQGVTVCFVHLGNSSYLELVQQDREDATTAGLVKKGFNFYHIGFTVRDFDRATEIMTDNNYIPLGSFNSEAFGNKSCMFFMSSQMELVEIIET